MNLHRRHSPDRGPSSTLLSRIAVSAVATVVGLVVVCVVMGAVTGPYLSQPAAARTAAPSAAVGASQMSYGPLRPTLIAVGPSSGTHSRESGRPGSTTTAARGPTPADIFGLGVGGIPVVALRAYRLAAARANGLNPSCGITWPLLAAIGRVESNHGQFAGAILHADGTSTPKIIGIPLDGHGTALIRDTDHGRLDGDVIYDRAVGPMQFIPSTWAEFSVDANGDHVPDPFNIFDAAAAAAIYLCSAGGNLATEAGQIRAVLAYNHSSAYLDSVLGLEKAYAAGVPGATIPTFVPSPPTASPPLPPDLPPVNPGPPPSLPPAAHPARPTPPTPVLSLPHPTPVSSSSATRPPEQPASSAAPSGTPVLSSSTPTPASSTTPPCPSATTPGTTATTPGTTASTGATSTSITTSAPPPVTSTSETATPTGSEPLTSSSSSQPTSPDSSSATSSPPSSC